MNATAPKSQLTVNNAVAGEATICLYGIIGDEDEGITANAVREALSQIPVGRKINLRIDSPGGVVGDGIAMFNAFRGRKRDLGTARIDAHACSIASIIPLAFPNVITPKSSVWMIHEPWMPAVGNADKHRATADRLDEYNNMLVDVYVEKTGKPRDTILADLKKETWLRGAAAVAYGLSTEECEDYEGIQGRLVPAFDLSVFKNVPDYVKNFAVLAGASPKTKPAADSGSKQNHMDKAEIIAALRARGDEVDESLTVEQLKAQLLAPPKAKAKTEPKATVTTTTPDLSSVQALADEVKAMRAEREKERQELAEARKVTVQAKVQKFADEGRIDANAVENWTKMAVADEKTTLETLASLPVKQIGTEAVGSIECVSDSLKDVSAHILNNGAKLTEKFIGANAGRAVDKFAVRDIHAGMVRNYTTIKKHEKMLKEAFNANTIDSTLKRDLILTSVVLREYEVPMLPFRQWTTVFESVPLEGTDKVTIPYVALQGVGESKSFSGTYTFTGNSSIGYRQITVGGDGDSATSGENATAGTVKDRMYQDISFDSYTLNRQPFFLLEKMFGMKGERLALDLFKAVVRRLVVTGNSYAVALTRAAAAFNSDDLANLWEIATGANWPTSGRQITLPHQYNTSLIKDPAFKAVYAAGNDEALRRAEIKKAYGFDEINIVPNLDTYMAANAAGWITTMDAIGVATANIVPAEDVRSQLSAWSIIGNPQTGISFAYRAWGAADTDAGRRIIECSIGAAKLVESRLQIIKKQ